MRTFPDDLRWPHFVPFAAGPPSTSGGGIAGAGQPSFPVTELNFTTMATATFANFFTTGRATTATNLLPSSASGFVFTTFAASVPRLIAGSGILIEGPATNLLLNSATPATQTTASLGTGQYCLWVNGAGSATPSGGTATITGAAAATQGNPNNFTVTVAGTIVITVAGALNAFQLEASSNGGGTSFISTAGATVTRNSDNIQTTALIDSLLANNGTGPAFSVAFEFTTFTQMNGTGGNNLLRLYDYGNAGQSCGWQSGPLSVQSDIVGVPNNTTAFDVVTLGVLQKIGQTADAISQFVVLGSSGIGRRAPGINGGIGTPGNLGDGTTGNRSINGYISRMRIWTGRLTDEQLIAAVTGAL